MRPSLFIIGLLFCQIVTAQQVAFKDYNIKNTDKTFSPQQAPVVFIDEAHHNFHTMEGRYFTFAEVLRSDGYKVVSSAQKLTPNHLSTMDILVISNALHEKNEHFSNWSLPNYSAFDRSEIEAVYHWVKNGGALFLIADHMPFPKAASDLAAIFGFHFNNGYVEDESNSAQVFSIDNYQLNNHPILSGLQANHKVSRIQAFTGQAFLSPPNAKPLLTFGSGALSYMPTTSWQFPDDTPTIAVGNWHQGATLKFGKGRLVVFGEAAMFTAQVSGKEQFPMGMNGKHAEQNERFLLNIMLWLSSKID